MGISIPVFLVRAGVWAVRYDYCDQATDEQLAALRRTRSQRALRLRDEAKAAEQLRHTRFAPATTPGFPRRLDAMTTIAATRELDQYQHTDLADLALPDLIPPAPPPADWATPDALKARTRPTGSAPSKDSP
ncbi:MULTISPECIES: hypothetical protein [Streptomyces]|uniref:Uncharacterized protein n=1 Tax=Streptomyces luteosporeus TaxID=173856 RepID=A0ABP6GFR3_9ACTN